MRLLVFVFYGRSSRHCDASPSKDATFTKVTKKGLAKIGIVRTNFIVKYIYKGLNIKIKLA